MLVPRGRTSTEVVLNISRRPFGALQTKSHNSLVRLGLHNKNLCGLVKAPVISLAAVHAKIRRDGYCSVAAGRVI